MSQSCPYCRGEMEQGWIQCRDGLTWSKSKRMVAAVQPLSASAVRLGAGNGVFSGTAAEAYLCRKCQKIVIDYGAQETP